MTRIEGVYAAAVTPRRLGVQDINLGVTWDLIDFLCDHGVDGIVLLGATGEFVHFSPSERMRLTGLAVKRSRVPVIINVSHSAFDAAVEMAQSAMAAGAVAVLVMPPHFYRYSQRDVLSFYRQFAEDADLDIPMLLYNIPIFTNGLAFESVRQLLQEGVAQGIKDSSGDWGSFENLRDLRSRHPFTLMMGNDGLYTAAWPGLNGVVSGVACAVPELLVSLHRALVSGAAEVITRLDLRLRQFIERIDKLPVPVGIKEAVTLRGIKAGPHAMPWDSETERILCEFREWFKGWLPTVQKECKHV
jgi:dihydrodipicolinate synthase/N-acetylneuraminate lyase